MRDPAMIPMPSVLLRVALKHSTVIVEKNK